MPLILGANSVTGGYEVDNSLRFNSASSDNLTRTPSTTTNRRTFTLSAWVKRSNLAIITQLFGAKSSTGDELGFDTSDRLRLYIYNNPTGTIRVSTQVFRDPSAWYHVVIAFDTPNATAQSRCRVYINGTEITVWTTNNTITQNLDTSFNLNVIQYVGRDATGEYFAGYMSEVYMIDGQQLDPTYFGETDEDTNIWKPKAYTGSFGTNGFYLEFQNSGALGTDSSGNGNNFTVNNLTSIDQTTDTCTNNFCTLNPLITSTGGSVGGLSDGNLTHTVSYQNGGTFFLDKDSTGKWYWECKVISGANSSLDLSFGFSSDRNIRNDGSSSWALTNTLWLYSTNGSKFTGSWTSSAGATFTNGDIIGMALDLNGDTITFYKNGVSQFTISSLTIDGTVITPWIQNIVSGCVVSANFGNPPFTIASGNADANGYGNFEYAVPSGYFALCTKNLADYG